MLVDAGEIEAAMRTPPNDNRARMRGRLVRQIATGEVSGRVDWDSAYIRQGLLRGKVVRLDAARSLREP